MSPDTNIKPMRESGVRLEKIDFGWATNSVNATIFRYNAIYTMKNVQVCAWYDIDRHVVLAKRNISLKGDLSNWKINRTEFTGNTYDAHNVISLIIDNDGYIHISWDHHVDETHYARSKKPYDILNFLTEVPHDLKESRLTYPEFYSDSNDRILFFYRVGASGTGDLVLRTYQKGRSNEYRWQKSNEKIVSRQTKFTFKKLFQPSRLNVNPYWQTAIDKDGGIHLSWVWRDTPDAATNHDLCYAYSPDRINWFKSNGEQYKLPISLKTAEVIVSIPRNSTLINTGTMTVTADKRPIIATYWKAHNDTAPQYKIVYQIDNSWEIMTISNRTLDFTLKGRGSLNIPISRPRILIDNDNRVYVIYRDDENNGRISVKKCDNIWSNNAVWDHIDLTENSVGKWEPNVDINRWKTDQKINMLVQRVDQPNNEKKAKPVESPVYILEWDPGKDTLQL